MQTPRLIIAALALAGPATLAGCGVGEASSTDSDPGRVAMPVPVEVAYPLRDDILATYAVTSTIQSDADAAVLARVPGELVELLAEEGDRVVAGQALARLDGERLRLEMLEASAKLEQAEKEYRRYMDLADRELVSDAMFDGLGFDLDALRASFELKQLNYDYATIRAPISGVISSRDVKPGQHISVGSRLFRITDTSELLAHLQIPQTELAKFTAGHAASLRVDAIPGVDFPAQIVRISPTIDTRDGTFRATAVIDNANGDLAPGMFARFSIAYERHVNALTIPASAVVHEDEENAVYVVDDGEAVRRVVTTGIVAGDRVEILDGLAEHEEIVVVGHAGLRDGSKVIASRHAALSFKG